MIRAFLAKGQRVVVPDLIGVGRSDKPESETLYTCPRHRTMLIEFVRGLNLANVTLVVQDWGGPLGLSLPQWAAARRGWRLRSAARTAGGSRGHNRLLTA